MIMEGMDFLNIGEILQCAGEYVFAFVKSGFSAGLILGAVLELLGYGIFKAVSLLNIK
jgi:hypothetical protein